MPTDRYDIVLAIPGLPCDGHTLATRSLGGSETAGLQLASAFARMGHRVTVFSAHGPDEREGVVDGVAYRRLEAFQRYVVTAPHDVTIVQRVPSLFGPRLNSRLNVLWCHDLALGRQKAEMIGTLWNLDTVVVLSDYMAQQYRDVYGPEVPLWQSRNGLDLGLVREANADAGPRHLKRLVWASRPERGLDVLLGSIWPRLAEADPTLTLTIVGYDNPLPADHPVAALLAACRQMAASWGARVEWRGALTKRDLYRLYATSGVLVYPTPSPSAPAFAEISCLTAMEAMACGLPMVTSDRGALPETLAPGAGVLVSPGEVIRDAEGRDVGARWTEAGVEAFCQAVQRLTTTPARHQEMAAVGQRAAHALGWDAVAAAWTDHIAESIARHNDDPVRLARHFWRRSDIYGARQALAGAEGPMADALRDRLARDYAWTDDPAAFAAHYRKIGDTHTDVFDQVPYESRFQHVEAWLRAHPEAQRLLDYGCAHGGYAINLCNRVGRTWVGVDVDARSIDWAERQRQTRATTPDALRFVEGDHTVDLAGEAPFDVGLAMEVLEHVPDPTAVIDALERHVAPGGRMLLTVPFGPWEYLSYDTYPYRCHLWEFDRHDLADLFGAKRDLSIAVLPAGKADVLDEPIGWHVIEYVVEPGRPTGRIDWARKLRLQRPRQTVSACLIAGTDPSTGRDPADTMGRTLKSLAHVADEVVIADTGLSPMARAIAEAHGARIVPSRCPLDPAVGFEGPRNDSVQAATGDWVLWLDTDEYLVEPATLHKYLRANAFHGYSLKQHHFAVDTQFPPDLPVRLFRRGPYTGPGTFVEADEVGEPETVGQTKPLAGRRARFYGMIHEHPELALNAGPGFTIVANDGAIFHAGYDIESTRRRRFARNLPLLDADTKRYPRRLLQKHFLCRDLILLNRYDLQQTGGRVTPEVLARCREVQRLYRAHFLGRGLYTGIDTHTYYSEALAMLGEGEEYAWQVEVDKATAKTNGTSRGRYANVDEFLTDFATMAKAKAAPFAVATW